MITLTYHALCILILLALFIGGYGLKGLGLYKEHRRQQRIIRQQEAKLPKAIKI